MSTNLKPGDILLFPRDKREWVITEINGPQLTIAHEFISFDFTKAKLVRIIELQPGTTLEEVK